MAQALGGGHGQQGVGEKFRLVKHWLKRPAPPPPSDRGVPGSRRGVGGVVQVPAGWGWGVAHEEREEAGSRKLSGVGVPSFGVAVTWKVAKEAPSGCLVVAAAGGGTR